VTGVKDGGRLLLRIPGKGRPAPEAGGAPGDLFVSVHSRPDPRFERRGVDLWLAEEIEPTDAVLGTTLRVPTLDGHARLRVPAGSQPGRVLRMPGKGLPEFRGDARGDLYVAIEVKIPHELSRAEKELWKQLREVKREREG
jgi:DnaJ-class molecular chaperone